MLPYQLFIEHVKKTLSHKTTQSTKRGKKYFVFMLLLRKKCISFIFFLSPHFDGENNWLHTSGAKSEFLGGGEGRGARGGTLKNLWTKKET